MRKDAKTGKEINRRRVQHRYIEAFRALQLSFFVINICIYMYLMIVYVFKTLADL